jgi:hypothetical protein
MPSALGRGAAPRLVSVEITREFNNGERFTLRFTGPEIEDMKLRVSDTSGPTVAAVVEVRGRLERLTPRYQGAAPVRRQT